MERKNDYFYFSVISYDGTSHELYFLYHPNRMVDDEKSK